ncbi:MAG: hypothetical protein MUF20_04465 [Methylotetracoccus sp.]|nr:hypothetical protein [Methylotetracoccus sp.]
MAKEVKPPASPDWQDGLDPALVLRLTSRGVRPGMIDLSQAGGIIDRHCNIAPALPLAERINRSWFEMTDQNAGSAPIVYVQPKPAAAEIGGPPVSSTLPTGPMQAADPKGGSATPMQPSVRLATSASTTALPLAPSSSAAVPGEGEQPTAPESRPTVSALPRSESQTVVVQRKPLDGPLPSLMPLAAPAPNIGVLSGSNHSPGLDQPEGKTGIGDRSISRGTLPVVSASTISRSLDVASQQVLPLANDAATRAIRTQGNGVPVVTPVTKLHSSLFIRSSDVRGQPADRAGRKHVPVQVTLPDGQANNALPRVRSLLRVRPQAKAASLPVVRESLVSEIRRGASPRYPALPLAGEAPRARQQTTEHPAGTRQSRSISARATAMEPRRPRQPVGRELITDRVTPPETNPQSAPNIDIEGIVDKVERRFARRFAIEAERRGKTRWR